MEALIPVINKLQDVFNTVGTESIQLPQIVVVGVQSSGKSSVLESLVGRDFLPRGPGIVTRRPLILQLINVSKDDINHRSIAEGTVGLREWAKFLHTREKIFRHFDEVKKVIEQETARVSGKSKAICAKPINLKIYSDRVVNLTLVDLPGITKIPVGDQPDDIEDQVRNLVLRYIGNPKSIILTVTPANTDFATSEALKLAREVDPHGARTLAVITKLDLMDAGTDAVDLLCGRVIPVKLGIIGVVNRSQQDNVNNKSIEVALKDEIQFLQHRYPTLAHRNGTSYLANTLNKLLMNHIRDCLPDLKYRINLMMAEYQTQLNSYGEAVDDKCRAMLQIITKFAVSYCASIEGTSKNIETTELSGGARITYIFHETFGNTLENINALEDLSSSDILTAIRNATGTRPSIFVPEVSFELLVKRQIERLEKPSLQCVDLVHEELQRIIQECDAAVQKEMLRFPKLYDQIVNVVTRLIRSRIQPARELVEHLIAMELSYVNSKHPDFIETANIGNLTKVFETEVPKMMNGRAMVEVKERRPRARGHKPSQNVDYASPDADLFDSTFYNDLVWSRTQESSWFCRQSLPERPQQVPSLSLCEGTLTMKMSPREQRDCRLIERLIQQYFNIVRRSVQDSVPKAIMLTMVNYIKENLQSELISQIYKHEDSEDLLAESEVVAAKRRQASEMLEALEKSSLIINELRDPNKW